MTFFNKKEEVFHIELTPHGRYLLSIGQLMPHHYKFFDDDIIYDAVAMGSSLSAEGQTEVHSRIINETPKTKLNPNVTGVETGIDLLKASWGDNSKDLNLYGTVIGPDLQDNRFDPLDDNVNFLQRPLGSTKPGSADSVAFSVDLFRGQLTSSAKFLESENTQTLNIPQIDIEVVYECSIEDPPNFNQASGLPDTSANTYYSGEMGNGKVYAVTPQNPIIRIKQDNSFDFKDNFEVRAFLLETTSLGGSEKQFYRPLKMIPQPKKIQNGLLVEPEAVVFSDEEITSDFLEYYFSIYVDKEIADEDICETIGDLKVRNIYLDEKLNCPDSSGTSLTNLDENYNIYRTRVDFDDLEDC